MIDWEKRYLDGDTPWDKGAPAPPLLELVNAKGLGFFGGGVVLVPGCGAGHDVRALACGGLQVLGVDIAPTALARARSQAPVGQEAYCLGDFLAPDGRLREMRFSAIWEHTCFCAIPPQRRGDYAAAAATLLPEGGVLAGVFFLTPHDPGDPAEGPPYAASVEEIEECFSPWFSLEEAWVPAAAYPGREGREWVALFRRK